MGGGISLLRNPSFQSTTACIHIGILGLAAFYTHHPFIWMAAIRGLQWSVCGPVWLACASHGTQCDAAPITLGNT